MQEQGGNARLAAGIAHHYLSAGDQPAALAAAVRAGDAAEEVHAHGEAARLYERALQLWSRVPDPEALAGHRPRDAAVPGRLRAPRRRHRARRGPLRGGARARSTRPPSPTAPPTCSSTSPTCAGVSVPPSAALTTLERGLALLPDDDAARSARCCSACERSSSCCAGAIAARSRRPAMR